MKKSVVVCDGSEGRCRTLADAVCPLCEKDFCREHFKASLLAKLCVTKPGVPGPGQGPFAPGQEKHDTHNDQEARVGICFGCYQDLYEALLGSPPEYVRTRMLESLTKGLESQMIEVCRAGLAVRKLSQK